MNEQQQQEDGDESSAYTLIALSKSKVIALVHKTKPKERAFLPNSTMEKGAFPGTLDCACRVNHTFSSSSSSSSNQGMATAEKDERSSTANSKRKAGATVAAHAMVWNVMEMHANHVKRSSQQLLVARDMHNSGRSSERATSICIAFSTLAWILSLLVMGLVLLVALVFMGRGGVAGGFARLTSVGARLKTRV